MSDPDTSEQTQQADEQDAAASHQADRMPTPEEEQIADGLELDPHVAESYKEAAERGAGIKGEGEI